MSDEERQPDEAGQQPARKEGSDSGRLSDTFVSARREFLDRLEQEGLTVAPCHFPAPGFGKIVRVEGRRYWQGF